MKLLRLFALCLLPCALVGCGTLEALRTPFVRTTNAVPAVVTLPAQTNTVAAIVEATTNTIGHVTTITPARITNFVSITPASFVTNWTTNVSVTVNPALESVLATAQTVNTFNPTPSAPIIDLALAGIVAGLGYFARVKSKQANERESIARTIVSGIEEANSAETKAAVAKLSAKLGNAPQINALVQRVTRGLS